MVYFYCKYCRNLPQRRLVKNCGVDIFGVVYSERNAYVITSTKFKICQISYITYIVSVFM